MSVISISECLLCSFVKLLTDRPCLLEGMIEEFFKCVEFGNGQLGKTQSSVVSFVRLPKLYPNHWRVGSKEFFVLDNEHDEVKPRYSNPSLTSI
jgi:hypothetical protein